MNPASRLLLRALAILFGAIPFAFGLIRAIETGTDVRYVWVALAAMFGGMIVIARVRRSGRSLQPAALAVAVFVTSLFLAIGTAMLLGTRLGPGILVVAAGFAGCFAAAAVASVTAARR